MFKSKKLTIIFIIILGLVSITLITCIGISKALEFQFLKNIEDTLIDGNGTKAKVIILAGQSNASGCSVDEYLQKNVSKEKYSEYENGYDNIYINYFASNNNISKGFVKCSTLQGEENGHFGPELGMAEKLNQFYPNEKFFIIKYAWGATDLFNLWLSPSSKGKTGDLYNSFVEYVNTSMKYLKYKNYDVEIVGMCWMQGESDSFTVENATNYEINLSNFIKDIRNAFSKYQSNKGIAFIDAYIADNPVYWVYCDLVNESKRKVSLESDLNVVIDTNKEGLTTSEEPKDNPDRAHYDSLSELKLGYLFIEKLSDFIDIGKK